ncbi:MAG TPA: D-alanine--D-alanine ligase [Gammaproteobacteria bacterium]|nr:D-alanine--D-alanine ligase [Gammaproteobacteria bacterium]
MFGKVAVLYGGNSAEREISLISGNAVFDALQRKGVDAEKIDTQQDFIGKLMDGNFSRAFIALHGRGGEDGTIQGLLDHLHIPYTGSGVLASALCMDKVRTKRIWQALGLATPPFAVWNPDTDVEDYVKIFGLPLAVKPVHDGSSIGVSRVNSAADFPAACNLAKQYGTVMIEPWIIGDEYTVCILGEEVLPSIQITSRETFYTYNAKYFSEETQHQCPGLDSAADEDNLRRLAMEAFNAVGATGWGRVDFIRDLNGDFWLLEVNTAPGMTPHSNMPLAAKVAGYSFDDLVTEVLSLTLGIGHTINV